MNIEATLTKREFEVVERIALGHPNKLVAYNLGISPNTVANIKKSAYEKTGVHCAVEMTLWYIYKKYNIKEIILSIICMAFMTINEFKSPRIVRTQARVVQFQYTKRQTSWG